MATKLEMVLEAIDRATGPINKVDDALDKLERNVRQSQGVMGRLGDVGGRAMRAIGTAAKVAAVAGVVTLTAAIGTGVDKAIAFESAMADVAKVADFRTPEALAQFSDDILDMSRHIPVAAEGLATITAEAIQSGIALKDSLDFTELTAKSSVAFDMTADAAGEAFAKIKNVFKLDMTGLTDAADAVNHLSNNMAAKAPQIIDFLQRAGGAAPLIGMTAEEMGGLGATMVALGTAPETAARGVTKLFTSLKVGSSNIEELVNTVGLTTESFNELLKVDPTGAIQKLFEAVQKSPDGLADLVALVGQDFADDFLKVANNTELLAQGFSLVAEKAAYSGSVLKEYQSRAATTANNIQLFKNNIAALQVEFGSRFLPTINAGLGEMIGIMQTLGSRATLFDRIGTGLRGFASGLGLTRDAASGLSAILDEAWTSVSQFLFGVADEEASADTIGRIFHDMQTAGEQLRGMLDRLANSAFVGQLRTNFASAGEIVADLSATLSNLLGEGSGGRAALDWLAGVSLDAVSATLNLYAEAQGRALGLLRDLSAWFAQTSGAIDWSALLPSGGFDTSAFDGFATSIRGILDAIEGFARLAGGTVVEYFTGYFEGLVPYLSSMGDRLSGAWDQIAPILENFGRVGTAIGRMLGLISENEGAMSAVQSFGRVIGSLAGIVGTISLGALEGLLRWVETMTGALAALFEGDFAGAGEEFKQFFAWLGGLVMPTLNLDLSGLQAAFDGMVSIIRSAWATIRGLFDDIISAAAGVGTAIADALSGGGAMSPADQLEAAATVGIDIINGPWTAGLDAIERYRQGVIDLEELNTQIRPFEGDAGYIGAYQNRVRRTLQVLDELIAKQNQVEAAAPNVPAPASAPAAVAPGLPNMAALNASQASVDQLTADAAAAQSAVAALGPQSQAIVATVTSAMAQVEAAANLNLFDKGAAMMDTLAAGMRSRAQAAVQEMQNLAQQLRDHLPSSPAKTGPLSDIHRLKFGETIAGSIHPEPVIKAMRALSAGAMDAARFAPAGLDGRLGLVPGLADHGRSIRLPADENDNGAGFFQRASASSAGAAPGAPSAGAGPSSGPIDASITIGTVQFGNPDDKAEFEALLRRHSKEIAEIMDYETRRRDRLRF